MELFLVLWSHLYWCTNSPDKMQLRPHLDLKLFSPAQNWSPSMSNSFKLNMFVQQDSINSSHLSPRPPYHLFRKQGKKISCSNQFHCAGNFDKICYYSFSGVGLRWKKPCLFSRCAEEVWLDVGHTFTVHLHFYHSVPLFSKPKDCHLNLVLGKISNEWIVYR